MTPTLTVRSLTIPSSRLARRHRSAIQARSRTIKPARGGQTTKIVVLVDALGPLMRFLLLQGQTHTLKSTTIGQCLFAHCWLTPPLRPIRLLDVLEKRGTSHHDDFPQILEKRLFRAISVFCIIVESRQIVQIVF